ncbi:MAG: leucine-rich repeat domain-containing protein [Spirochaetaceae bacterium]|jgi:hypothetical protein|nr:leucine-rich repeat domain-containing protein [Spirochaetaceae bacterium]
MQKYLMGFVLILLCLGGTIGCDFDESTDSLLPSAADTASQEPEQPDSSTEDSADTGGESEDSADTVSQEPVPVFEDRLALQDYLAKLPKNTPEEPYPIRIHGLDLSKKNSLMAWYAVLSKFVALDLRECTGSSIGNALFLDEKNPNPGMAQLVSIIFPETVTVIENNRFADCPNLRAVEGVAVTSLSSAAFARCPALKSAVFPKARELKYTSNSTERGVFSKSKSLETVIIPKAETIGNYAFYDCASLQTLVLPNVKSFGVRVFKGSGITTLTLGETVPSLEAGVFEEIPLPKIYVPDLGAYQETEISGWTAELKAVIKALPEHLK